MPDQGEAQLVHVGSLDDLAAQGRRLVKVGRKQIALFHGEKGVFACNNRCPHEGFPLMEGSLAEGCVLTCNWHNWKFDLESGETLVGGDALRRYPVRLRGDEIWLDVADPPPAARAAKALEGLRASFRRHEYDQMAREISRLQRSGADPLDALRRAIDWTHDHLEFGTTHAHAAAPDWLALRENLAPEDPAALVPLVEVVGNLAWDTLREPAYPYAEGPCAEGQAGYSPEVLVAAIEGEDEAAAVALLRGALAEGLGFPDLERPLATAALAHYQDFGHSVIYVYKTGQLIRHLGPSAAEPLLLALLRSLVYARREDLIPEFRAYGGALAAWDGTGRRPVEACDLTGLGVPQALARTLESSADPQALFGALLGAAAWQQLHFDLERQGRHDQPISQNVGWLDFTHGITFGNAVRVLCGRYPELWPRGLLQMACFLGRNARFVDPEQDVEAWAVPDRDAFFKAAFARLLDHGAPEYIVSCHLVKVLTAVREEVEAAPDAAWVPTLLAATRRFLESPLKRKHSLRTAYQAAAFTAIED
ncbi:MAG: Rieske 2Fe-2S domain-containing protein [Kiloniellales bacterium]|nr:Rieske 2Fe-2S domain-containing protein [Kiloniellales bacterium]